MEIYQREVGVATHEVYVGDSLAEPSTPVSYFIADENGNKIDHGVAAGAEGRYTAILGLNVSEDTKPKIITWSYRLEGNDITTIPERIEVVRPYITLQEYNRNFPYRQLGMRNFRVSERTVRRVIDAYCRQTFQIRQGRTRVVPGTSTNSLQLPDRLVRLSDIRTGSQGSTGGYTLRGAVTFHTDNPWALYTRSGDLSPRQADPTYRSHHFGNTTYYITGDWGWEYVPSEVRDAAAILINDFLDDDSVYREKYIDNIRAADWRMEFAATGNETTGNANADMMLEKFRNYRPEVI